MRDTRRYVIVDEAGPRRFYVWRGEDVSGVSGVGRVAWGCRFPDGATVMRWCVPGKPAGLTFYESVAELEEVHGHDGRTIVVWIDPARGSQRESWS